jgi:signal transduction histidine kinase
MMTTHEPDSTRVMKMAAGIWLAYLICLLLIDVLIYSSRPAPGGDVLGYHALNFAPALLFVALAFAQGKIRRPQITTLALILLISSAPVLVPNLFDLKLPPAPLSNLEGMVLRQLPVLMIGLVLVAWHYDGWMMALYAAAVNALELVLVFALDRLQGERLWAFVFIVIIRLVCFIVVGIFINHLIGSLRRQQAALTAANRQLAHYASTLETLTVSRERNRMSRELHDTVVHTLSGLSVQLETASAYLDVNPDTARQLIAQALQATRSGLQETRRALKSLRASPLQDLGLLIAIRTLAASAAERGKFALDLSLPEGELPLPPEVEQCVYRITQEALENAVHHASAKRLMLHLTAQDNTLMLRIQDDGIGFRSNQPHVPGHYGLPGMQERAELVGGTLHIESAPERGTTIRLILKDYLQ